MTDKAIIYSLATPMSASITDVMRDFVSDGHLATIYSMGDDFTIIDNPTFAVLPNHPYRSPLVVAVYCRAGHGTGRVNARTFHLEPHSFMIILPGQITELVDLSADFSAIYVLMSDEFVESLSIGNSFSLRNTVVEQPCIALTDRAYAALESYLTMCCNLIPVESNPHRMEILRLITHAFFLGLGYFMHDTGKSVTMNHAEQLSEQFIQLVEQNYRLHRAPAYYADALCLTPKYLSAVVRRITGHSVLEWIERYVTLDAITQLTSTNRTIKQIAYDLNFPSQSFFGKYFSRIVGMSPTEYRKKQRAGLL